MMTYVMYYLEGLGMRYIAPMDAMLQNEYVCLKAVEREAWKKTDCRRAS